MNSRVDRKQTNEALSDTKSYMKLHEMVMNTLPDALEVFFFQICHILPLSTLHLNIHWLVWIINVFVDIATPGSYQHHCKEKQSQ